MSFYTDEQINNIVDSILKDAELFSTTTTELYIDNNKPKNINIDKEEKEIEYLLKPYECDICFQDDLRNINKISLECGHNLCISCINKIIAKHVENNKESSCPYCRIPLKIKKY
jgi:hypothetical protein